MHERVVAPSPTPRTSVPSVAPAPPAPAAPVIGCGRASASVQREVGEGPGTGVPTWVLVAFALALAGFAVGGPGPAAAQDAFVTTWKTTSAGESITIPTHGGGVGAYDFEIHWGDGTTDTITGTDPDPSHTYAQAGTHTVAITGTFPRLFLNAWEKSGGDKENARKLRSVEQWGAIQWKSMDSAFEGAEYVAVKASDVPDLSSVTDMCQMFRGARFVNPNIGGWDVSNVTAMDRMFEDAARFNQDLGSWDVSSVTTMNRMFEGASDFNQDLGDWDVSGVTDMSEMFLGARAFNQDLGDWDVSSVTNMNRMFEGASSFNQDLGDWAVSSVINMNRMFKGAGAFNQDLGGWDLSGVTTTNRMFEHASSFNQDLGDWNVSSVTDMSEMFRGAQAFNQDLSGWDVSGVTTMRAMFEDASSFDQDLGDWDVSGVTDVSEMLVGTDLSTAHYDALLIGWSRLDLQSGMVLDAGATPYTETAAEARQSLLNEQGWTIHDGGETAGVGVTLTDGSAYEAPAATSSTAPNPIGRGRVHAVEAGPFLHDLTVSLEGENQGITAVQLWRSGDDAFDAGADTLLQAEGTDPATSTPDTVSFSGLDGPEIGTAPQYFFVAVAVAEDEDGAVRASLRDPGDLTIPGGTLTNDAGAFPLPLSSASAPLPVEVAGFEAQVEGDAAHLRWQTVSEARNAGFEVQRKGDGESWRQIAFVESKAPGGTATEPRSYRHADTDLPYDADSLTYRLRQVDLDGTASVTRTVTVGRRADRLALRAPSPNPARRRATVRFALPTAQDPVLRLYDGLGRQVRSVRLSRDEGRHQVHIRTADLASGVYFLRLTAGGQTRTQKLTIAR